MAASLDTIAIVGAGTMGTDMAVRFAAAGCRVHVMARPGPGRDRFAQRVQRSAADLDVDAEKLKLELVSRLEDLPWPQIDLVIENVSENAQIKHDVFRKLVALARPDTPLASNSSTFSVRVIADGLDTQERMLGLHFFMPAHLVPLIEVVLTDRTDRAMAQEISAALTLLGFKTVTVKKDVPGFLANRIQAAMLREVWHVIDSGIASPEDVDTAVRYGFGFRFVASGPVMQKEMSGLDVTAAAGASLYPHLSKADRPAAVLTEKVARGEFGMKTGKGFWQWDEARAKAERARYTKALKAALAILQAEEKEQS